MTEDVEEKGSQRKVIVASILVLIITVLSASAVLYYSTTPKAFDCTNLNHTTQMTGQGLLSGFPIECIRILNRSNNSTISDGLVYVAENGQEQAQGFQYATSFGDCNGFATNGLSCDGMIFNFSSSQELCFWMHNTLIPLQQVWITQNGTVVSVYQAISQSDFSVCHYAKYVLETVPNVSISLGNSVILNSNQT